MSHNPGPGVSIPASVWTKTIKIPASTLSSGPIQFPSSIIGREQILDEWPMTETDMLREEAKRLTKRVSELESAYAKQDEHITHLYRLIEELQENQERRQNNSGQYGYQVAGLVARDYWQTSQE